MSILQNIDHGESNYKIFKKKIYLNYLQKGKKTRGSQEPVLFTWL